MSWTTREKPTTEFAAREKPATEFAGRETENNIYDINRGNIGKRWYWFVMETWEDLGNLTWADFTQTTTIREKPTTSWTTR